MSVSRLVAVGGVVFVAMAVGCRRPTERIVYVTPPLPVAPTRVAQTMSPVSSSQVASGELAGIVVDDSTGQRLGFARIALSTALGGTISDSTGRFRLKVPAGTPSARVMLIGYDSIVLPQCSTPGWFPDSGPPSKGTDP